MHLPADSAEQFDQAITQAEELTSVEFVVCAVPFSGSYRDLSFLCGSLASALVLGWVLFGPLEIPAEGVIPGLLVVWAMGAALCRWSPALRRMTSSRARRARQAQDAANLRFRSAGIDDTRGRTGLLIYLSFLERTVVLVADRGIRQEVSADELDGWASQLRDAFWEGNVPALCTKLQEFAKELGERLPPDPDNPNELSNALLFEASR